MARELGERSVMALCAIKSRGARQVEKQAFVQQSSANREQKKSYIGYEENASSRQRVTCAPSREE